MESPAAILDVETAHLVLKVQLDDVHELSKRSKGKQKEGAPIDDFWVAVNIYHEELESAKRTLSDGGMSMSISRAVRDDGNLIREWAEEEAQAAEDRRLAVQLETGKKTQGGHHTPRLTETGTSTVSAKLLDKFAALFGLGPDGRGAETDTGEEAPAQPESSSWAASRRSSKKQQQQQQHRCAICLDEFPPHEVSRAPCAEHDYCRGCLSDLFTRSLTDETLFPPRCCGQPIPVEPNRVFLAPALVGQFLARKVEMETPAAERTYCHRPGCSAFIPRRLVRGDVGACPRCGQRTCAVCKGAAPHPGGGDCPEDGGLREVLRVAAEMEWQRCYSCRSVVELSSGCHHISKSSILPLPPPSPPKGRGRLDPGDALIRGLFFPLSSPF